MYILGICLLIELTGGVVALIFRNQVSRVQLLLMKNVTHNPWHYSYAAEQVTGIKIVTWALLDGGLKAGPDFLGPFNFGEGWDWPPILEMNSTLKNLEKIWWLRTCNTGKMSFQLLLYYKVLSSRLPSGSQMADRGSFQLDLETWLFFSGQNVLPYLKDSCSLPTSISNTTDFCRRPCCLQACYNDIKPSFF